MQDITPYLSVLKKHGYQQDDALVLLMRLQLIKIIKSEILRRKWSQREAAKILGISQPRIAEISVLATEKFSLETLIKYLSRLHLKASLLVKPGKHYMKPPKKRRSAPVKSQRLQEAGGDQTEY